MLLAYVATPASAYYFYVKACQDHNSLGREGELDWTSLQRGGHVKVYSRVTSHDHHYC